MNLKEIVELCKGGRAQEAYAASQQEMNSTPANPFGRIGLGCALKSLMERAAHDGDTESLLKYLEEFAGLSLEEVDADPAVNNRIAWALRAYVLAQKENGTLSLSVLDRIFEQLQRMNFVKPHRYYSVLLDTFVKVKDADGQPWSRLPEFVRWWGLENLLPEDYERVLLNNGEPMASLAERAYNSALKALVAEVAEGRQHEAAESMISDLEVLEETHPEYHNVLYQKSKLLKALGEDEKALAAARAFAKKRPTEFRSWAAMGDITDDDRVKVACYSRALLCRVDPMFQGKVRYKLAVAMYQIGDYSHAKREMEKIRQLYEMKGWHVPAGVETVSKQSWFLNTPEAESNRPYYYEHGREAEDFLCSDVPETAVLIATVNPQKQIATFVTADHQRGYFSTKKYPTAFRQHQIHYMRFEGELGSDKALKVLRFRRANDFAEQEGKLFRKTEAEINMRPGQAFLFVDDIYVEGALLKGIRPGTLVEIVAILYYNIKKDSWGWRAIRVTPSQTPSYR